MVKKVKQVAHVQKTGDILRTTLIWAGFLLAVAAGLMLVFSDGNLKVELALVVAGMLCYGFALRDFDIDDDD